MTDAGPATAGKATLPAPGPRITPRLASRALVGAVATLVASMVAISLYFAGAGESWGPVNDLLVVATVLLLLPAMVALPRVVGDHVGGWLGLLSGAAAAGIFVVAAGQLALVAGAITLDMSFISGGLGVLPIIVWVGATGVVSLRTPLLGRGVGAWALLFLGLIGLTVAVSATVTTDTATLTGVLGVPLAATLVGWLLSLGRGLAHLDRSS